MRIARFARVGYSLPVRLAGYRKLLVTALALVCGTVLQVLGKLDATSASFLGGIAAAYCGANVGARALRVPPAGPT